MAAELAPGTWEMTKSHNFDEYLKALDLGWTWRVMGNAARPKQEISILDGLWTITTSTPVTKVKLQFELDKEFDETTADGRKVKSVCTVEGNKLITRQKGPVDSSIVRDFTKDNFVMTLTAKGVTATRHYKRIS